MEVNRMEYQKFLEASIEEIEPEHLGYTIRHLRPQDFINRKEFEETRIKLENKLKEVNNYHNQTKTKAQEERQQRIDTELKQKMIHQIKDKHIKITTESDTPIKLNSDGTFDMITHLGYKKHCSLISVLSHPQLSSILGSNPSQNTLIQISIGDRKERMEELKKIGFPSNAILRRRKQALETSPPTQVKIYKV